MQSKDAGVYVCVCVCVIALEWHMSSVVFPSLPMWWCLSQGIERCMVL